VKSIFRAERLRRLNSSFLKRAERVEKVGLSERRMLAADSEP
jgi:hypothetical protein